MRRAVKPRYRRVGFYAVAERIEHIRKSAARKRESAAVILKIFHRAAVFVRKRLVNVYGAVKITAYQPAVKFTHRTDPFLCLLH